MEVILSPSHSHRFLKGLLSVFTNKRSFVLPSEPQNLHNPRWEHVGLQNCAPWEGLSRVKGTGG